MSSRPTTSASSVAVVPASEGSVEVDQVHPLSTRALPAQRGLDRVAEDALAPGDALDELNGTAVGDIDGGQQFESGHERSLIAPHRSLT